MFRPISPIPPSGTIRIAARVLPAEQRQRPLLELTVSDSGHGMSLATLDADFRKFGGLSVKYLVGP